VSAKTTDANKQQKKDQTMTTTAKLTINSLVAASVDIGDAGRPGESASKICCTITARRDGRWDCMGSVSTGCNQGYYQENYSYGPWLGRGATPRDAVAAMVSRTDDQYQGEMRHAGSDALLESDGATFASLSKKEADRIEQVQYNDRDLTIRQFKIAGKLFSGTLEARHELRSLAIKVLRKCAPPSPLDSISDDELLAEAKRRGLIAQ
jgi:hypothetical protein